MTTLELVHSQIKFAPDLDLEEVEELPGKEVMSDLRNALDREEWSCSKLVQDSHGWCFKIGGSDSRTYLLELCPIESEAEDSQWILHCDRCVGFRFWEIATVGDKSLEAEQRLLENAAEILVSQLGFSRSSTA